MIQTTIHTIRRQRTQHARRSGDQVRGSLDDFFSTFFEEGLSGFDPFKATILADKRDLIRAARLG